METAAAKLAKLYANLRSPTVSIDLALPWITGSPYALYAHVRAITSKGVTSWSAPYGFNIRWSSIPKDLNSPHPGLVRWSPVEGATAYQVWLHGAKSTFEAQAADVADARSFAATSRRDGAVWTSAISFRVRAKHTVYGGVRGGQTCERRRPGPVEPALRRTSPAAAAGARDAGRG